MGTIARRSLIDATREWAGGRRREEERVTDLCVDYLELPRTGLRLVGGTDQGDERSAE